jgi:hypothetical protein
VVILTDLRQGISTRISLSSFHLYMTRLSSAAVTTGKPDTISQKTDSAFKVRRKNADPSQGPTKDESRPGTLCYTCGEDGHLKRDCEGKENRRKVNKCLIS